MRWAKPRHCVGSSLIRVLGPLGCGAVLLSATMASTAPALARLGELLAPAYIAMNFATLCGQVDPSFLLETSGPRGTALEYARHVKDEVVVALTYEEAVIVLKMAADAARSATRRELKTLAASYPAIEEAELVSWCEGRGKSFVLAFIDHHDSGHAAFLQQVERAKQ